MIAKYFLVIGFILVLIGLVLPILIIMHFLESTYFLNFFSYASSTLGLLLGIAGSAYITVYNRRKKQ